VKKTFFISTPFILSVLFVVAISVFFINNTYVKETAQNINAKVASSPSSTYRLYNILQGRQLTPTFLKVAIDPRDVKRGQTQTMTIYVKDEKALIKSITAKIKTDTKQFTYPLSRISGTDKNGEWQGSWVVNDTHDKAYTTQFIATDSLGNTNNASINWTDPVGGDGCPEMDVTIADLDIPSGSTMKEGSLKVSGANLTVESGGNAYIVNSACAPYGGGSGNDGAVTLTSSVYTSHAPSYIVSSLGTNTITTSAPPTGIIAGDEVMLINLQGSTTYFSNVGNYENFYVTNVTSNTLTLGTNITQIYGATTSNSNLTGQNVAVQRVPNWTNVTVNSGVTVSASSWNGNTGGLLAFRGSGTVTINGGIVMDSTGYAGGAERTTKAGGFGGESFCGLGGQTTGADGAGGAGADPVTTSGGNGYCGGGGGNQGSGSRGLGSTSYGGSGGGGSRGGSGSSCISGAGAGAGYGTIGHHGTGGSTATNGQTNASGDGGSSAAGCNSGGGGGTYGVANLSNLYLGSGGGGGGPNYTAGGPGGPAGAGGGIIFIAANALVISPGYISNGGGGAPSDSGYASGGGGGSGGSVYLYTNTATINSGSLNAIAGPGGCDGTGPHCGGDGGAGRIAIHGTVTGTSNPVYTSF